MAKKIIVDWNLRPEELEKIRLIADGAGYSVCMPADKEEAAREAADAQIIYGKNLPTVRAAKELKWLCTQSAGVNDFVIPGVLPEGCILTNSSGAYGVTLSEHMIMVTLMLMRRYQDYAQVVECDKWHHDFPMRSIRGSVLTLLGTGDIGTNYAKRARAFSPARIIGINRTGRKPSDDYDEIGMQSELDRYLPQTDVLVMSLPETQQTRGILSRERLALLPAHALIVNVGRGSSIDEAALVDALNEGKIAGAALDVMQHEPLPLDDPLRTARNILLTPHTAGQMTLGYTREKSIDMFCENLKRYLAGETLENRVDLKAGY